MLAIAGGVVCTMTKVVIQLTKLDTALPRARMRVVEIYGNP